MSVWSEMDHPGYGHQNTYIGVCVYVCEREDSFAYLPVEFRHDSSINPKDAAAVAADRPRRG